MERFKRTLEAFQNSALGLFLKKFSDDQGTNLAALLAWGTLNTLLPLLLGILAITGLVLRDSQRVDQVYSTLVALVPQEAAGPLGNALDGVRRESAAPASIIGVVLLLYNGSSFFSNMASVFDQVFHVDDRNILLKPLVSVGMLVISTALLLTSVVTLGLGSIIDALAQVFGIGPVMGRLVTWTISILSAVLLFWLLYRVLPNKRQTWGQALPGALLATVLFFVILLVFPLYVTFFPPNQAYAVFGIFLVLTFWLYLLGIVFVLGAELNAFLQEPARSVALAEATQQAQRGKASIKQEPGRVHARSQGTAPSFQGSEGSAAAQVTQEDQRGEPHEGHEGVQPRPGIGGRVLGLIGLIVAALVLRGRSVPEVSR